jgi:hypothetical protein
MGKFSRDAIIAVLAATVGGILVAAVTFYYFKAEADLSFVRFPATSYHDATRALSIYSVNLENSGNRQADAVDVEVSLAGQAQFVGFSYDKSMDLIDISTLKSDTRILRFQIRELNPGQYVTFSFLGENSLGQQVRFEAATSGQIAHEGSAKEHEQYLWSDVFAILGLLTAIIVFIINVWFRDIRSKLRSVDLSLGGLRVRAAQPDDVPTPDDLWKFLRETPLELIYNPAKPGATKDISFLPDGQIGRGKNQNETSWRVVDDALLEILNADGAVHNRFEFDPKQRILVSTNDSDTIAVRVHKISNQWIREAAV